MAKQALRIEISANSKDQLKLVEKIYSKHTTVGNPTRSIYPWKSTLSQKRKQHTLKDVTEILEHI